MGRVDTLDEMYLARIPVLWKRVQWCGTLTYLRVTVWNSQIDYVAHVVPDDTVFNRTEKY